MFCKNCNDSVFTCPIFYIGLTVLTVIGLVVGCSCSSKTKPAEVKKVEPLTAEAEMQDIIEVNKVNLSGPVLWRQVILVCKETGKVNSTWLTVDPVDFTSKNVNRIKKQDGLSRMIIDGEIIIEQLPAEIAETISKSDDLLLKHAQKTVSEIGL